ncbi:MAG: RpiB/LacA/LacB family sugar-phosphate isomerase [Candidatus Zambryskibacteria bacterium]|nr:RpiB/LacA/LacB family sugar-phosphate isomerase [Candidatus Zambryskibacteria bacterium]
MKIFIGADHAGFELKEKLIPFLKELEHEVEDKGAFTYDANDDYPDFIKPVAEAVSNDSEAKGIVIGKSGQGEAMCANRFKNVRAVVWYGGNREPLRLSRSHNDANILSIGAGLVGGNQVLEAVQMWLETPFSGDERHVRRIGKIEDK